MDTTILNENQSSQLESVPVENGKTNTAIAGITGVTLGATGTLFIGKLLNSPSNDNASILREDIDESNNDIIESNVMGEVAIDVPIWVVDNIQVAHNVDDRMSFSQAFAAARAEVGPGGAFEWRGSVYGTYYADEWNNMTDAEKNEYNNHFNWNKVQGSTITTAHDISNNEIEVEMVSTGGTVQGEINTEPEIEVLGVVHDYETGVNIGGMTIDGQGVVLIDVDGDMEFDIAASDLNYNGQIDYGEAVDIHGNGMTVDQLGGFLNPEDSLLATDDAVCNDDPYFNA